MIYNYLCNQCLSPIMLWVRIPLRRGVLDITLCDKVCQWFSLGTRVSSTNKTDRHDITEIFLKVALCTINQTTVFLWFTASDYSLASSNFLIYRKIYIVYISSWYRYHRNNIYVYHFMILVKCHTGLRKLVEWLMERVRCFYFKFLLDYIILNKTLCIKSALLPWNW